MSQAAPLDRPPARTVEAYFECPVPRKYLRRWLPSPATIRQESGFRFLERFLRNRSIWQLNRRSVANAAAVGLFIAFLPIPCQMLVVVAAAIWLRFNLPVGLVMVWTTNPLTLPIIFYAAYRWGSRVLGRVPEPLEIEISLAWFTAQLSGVWEPLLLGCLMMGVTAAGLSYATIHLLWRAQVVRAWRERRRLRALSRG